jgi:D-alanyl-D-alanine carboxypeptidase
MKGYAWEVGASTAFFADPSGLSPLNSASAKDIFALAQYLYKYRQDILEITRTIATSTASTTDHAAHDFVSIHPFVQDPRFIGGKTGRTIEAGETMMTIMNIKGHILAFIILASGFGDRAYDTKLLIDQVSQSL